MTGNRILMAEEIKKLKAELKIKNEIVRQLKALIKSLDKPRINK